MQNFVIEHVLSIILNFTSVFKFSCRVSKNKPRLDLFESRLRSPVCQQRRAACKDWDALYECSMILDCENLKNRSVKMCLKSGLSARLHARHCCFDSTIQKAK